MEAMVKSARNTARSCHSRHPAEKLGDIARRFGAQINFTPSHPISCLIICPAFSGPMSKTSGND
jgi:hypothetical protein